MKSLRNGEEINIKWKLWMSNINNCICGNKPNFTKNLGDGSNRRSYIKISCTCGNVVSEHPTGFEKVEVYEGMNGWDVTAAQLRVVAENAIKKWNIRNRKE